MMIRPYKPRDSARSALLTADLYLRQRPSILLLVVKYYYSYICGLVCGLVCDFASNH